MISTPVQPTAEYVDYLADSRMWQRFRPRAGDVVVVTPPKSGTTWTQAIVSLLLFPDHDHSEGLSVLSPWIDAEVHKIDEVIARLEGRAGRRHVKTHTPLDGIPFWPDLRYICVYRHPIDVFFSWRNHERNMTFELEDLPIIDDLREDFRDYLGSSYRGTAGARLPGVVHHFKCSLAQSSRTNVLLLHYADMVRDLAGTVAQIANHIGVSLPPDALAAVVKAATFGNMKANAHRFAPAAGEGVWHQEDAFFESGSSNKWEGRLTKGDLSAYDSKISQALSPDERAWLEWGSAARV